MLKKFSLYFRDTYRNIYNKVLDLLQNDPFAKGKKIRLYKNQEWT